MVLQIVIVKVINNLCMCNIYLMNWNEERKFKSIIESQIGTLRLLNNDLISWEIILLPWASVSVSEIKELD